jgi:addiction module HigA family antidote
MATEFKPNYAIHPGVLLKEEMDDLKVTQKELSDQTGIAKTVINEIIKGKRRINAETAVKLEKVLYSPAQYWLNLQSLYDEALARIKLNKNDSPIVSMPPINRTTKVRPQV